MATVKKIIDLAAEKTSATKSISLTENFISSLIGLALSPKVKKVEKQLKTNPEYQSLEKRAKEIQDELDKINKKLELIVNDREKAISKMKSLGVRATIDMNADQLWNSYEDWKHRLNAELKKIKPNSATSADIEKLLSKL